MERGNIREILSVSALNERIKALLEEGFPLLWVEGEVSNLHRPASGHVYFTLKDAKSQIRAVIFRTPFGRGRNGAAGFAIEEGMGLVCRARLSVYPPRGDYQLIVDAVEPKGLGALQKAFEQLKARLEAEGLFAPDRKRPIPFLPERIGVVTSPTGAVIRDILTVTGRRFPSVPILIVPVRVQGFEAPADIIRALDEMPLVPGVDVIILARGGGSLEDLSAFNDEGVARAIARSPIPVISAVGHETDFTIADFTADLRVATPSAAAEMVVPRRADLREAVESLRLRLIRLRQGDADRLRERVAELAGRLRDPKRRLAEIRLALDDAQERMRVRLDHLLKIRRQDWIHLAIRLEHRNPRGRIAEGMKLVDALGNRLQTSWQRRTEQRKNRLQALLGLLDSLSPLAVLNRGYSITRRLPEGTILRQVRDIPVGQRIAVRLAAGNLQATVTEIFKEAPHGQGEV